jgi:hypothetical protein
MGFTDQHFLEPPHQHNPDDLDEIFLDSQCFLQHDVHSELRDSHEAFCTSISITFASLKRQRKLFDEWADLQSGETHVGSSRINTIEYLRFSTTRRMQAEIFYFEDEVMPDWRHKAQILQARIDNMNSTRNWVQFGIQKAWLTVITAIVRKWWEESRHLKDEVTICA